MRLKPRPSTCRQLGAGAGTARDYLVHRVDVVLPLCPVGDLYSSGMLRYRRVRDHRHTHALPRRHEILDIGAAYGPFSLITAN